MSSCGIELCDMTQPNHPHSVTVCKKSFIFADPFGLAGPRQEEWRQGNSQCDERLEVLDSHQKGTGDKALCDS